MPAAQDQQGSFVQRLIEIAITLNPNSQSGQPTKFTSGTDTVTLSGSRTVVRIENNGAAAGNVAHVQVYGLTPNLMTQLATMGMLYNQIQQNTILISAGNKGAGLTPVFSGTIVDAFGDYNGAPDVPFHFEAQSGLVDSILPVPASSFTGPTDVATIMAGFASTMQKGFENNGITAQLSSPYIPGNITQQWQKVARDANIEARLVDGGSKLAIWPKGGSRNNAAVPISPETGMIGYPSYTRGGLIVRTIFNPLIALGGKVQVTSSLGASTNKTWVVNKLDLALDSLMPSGQWMGTAHCYPSGFLSPPPQQ